MKPILQSESSECGLACLAMVFNHHGYSADLIDLRRKFSVGLKGVRLSQLIRHAEALDFSARAVRLELDELQDLRLPAVLHWDLDHFVVLAKVGRNASGKQTAVIYDPAVGKRTISLAEMSTHFTGVALELFPAETFEKNDVVRRMPLSSLTGKMKGIVPAIVQLILMAVVLELFAIISPLFNQYVLDNVIVSGDQNLLSVLAIGFGLLLFAQISIDLMRSWFLIRWSMDVSTQWMTRVLRHMVRLPNEYFEKRHVGDLVSRFSSVNAIQSTLTSVVLVTLLDGVMAIAALVIMFLYSAKLGSIVLGGCCAYGALRWAAYAPFKNASNERIVLAAKESTYFLETIRGMLPVKLFGRESERVTRWLGLRESVNQRDMETQKLQMMFRVGNSLISGTRAILVFYIGAKLVMSQELTVGMLMAFTSYSLTFSSRFSSLIDTFVSVKLLSIHTERLADIVLEPIEEDLTTAVDPGFSELEANISLRNIRFRYADGEPWVLDGINLDIKQGEHIAITGPSGCGKTTLVKIILGLLPATEGEVLIGGKSLKQIGKTAYRQLIGSVMQNDTLLAGTLAENISFFDVEADAGRISEVAKQASIHQEISAMPMGYQTLVGDMGSALSGGQKQRVLLARALFKQPKLLALDEATSHLDLINEKMITQRLDALKVTRIMVAHRPETVANADRVIFVANGSVQISERRKKSESMEKEPSPSL